MEGKIEAKKVISRETMDIKIIVGQCISDGIWLKK